MVSVAEVRESLRLAFETWGLPVRLRVDNGYPWGSHGDLPTELALWLLGLGIDLHWNPPRRPQDNGVVERSQGVGKNWAEPQTCATFRLLQRRVDKFDRIQRERYPAIGKLSRMAAYPALMKPKRRYQRTQERRIWRWNLVTAHLREYAVIRKVDSKGSVSIYKYPYYVGDAYVGQHVVVTYDAVEHEWDFHDGQGNLLRRQPARALSAERVLNLDVLRHQKSRSKQARQN